MRLSLPMLAISASSASSQNIIGFLKRGTKCTKFECPHVQPNTNKPNICIPSQLKKRKACFAHFYFIKSNHSIGLFYYLNKHPIQILAPSLQEYTKPTQAGLSRICELYILHFTVSDHYCRVYTGTPLTT